MLLSGRTMKTNAPSEAPKVPTNVAEQLAKRLGIDYKDNQPKERRIPKAGKGI